MKKLGIIGLGSIGSRHAKMLHELGIGEVRALRTRKGEIKDKSNQLTFVEEFTDENKFFEQLDGVIISNPTSLHTQSALKSLKRGIPTFIEKPMADDVVAASALNEYRHKLIIGYCFRFSGFVEAIKQFIAAGNLGRLYKASFSRSFYLPKWHPYADYRNEYTAKKSLGGGAIRTLSHEIDLMLFLFGYPMETMGYSDKVSDLEIDTDDLAFFSCKMNNGGRVNFELDFLSPNYINHGEIIGEKGKLEYDMKAINFIPFEGESRKVYDFRTDEFDIMYLNQMKDFIGFIDSGRSENCSYEDAIETMRIIEEVDKL